MSECPGADAAAPAAAFGLSARISRTSGQARGTWAKRAETLAEHPETLSVHAEKLILAVMHSPEEPLLPHAFPGGHLRRLRQSDLAAFQAYRAIPELGRFQAWLPMSETAALAFLSEMNGAPLFTPGAWVQIGIAESETDHLIGDIGLFLSDDGFTGKVGFTLAPSAQGRGIATSAVRHALQVFFRATPARQVQGITDNRNAASIRLLERIGFRHYETRTVVFRGEECSKKIYLLPRTD